MIPVALPTVNDPSIIELSLKVATPDTFNCFVNNVSPVTVVIPANVETPVTFKAPVVVPPETNIPSLVV